MRRRAPRCPVASCGKPLRKGQAILHSVYGDYGGLNDDGGIKVSVWWGTVAHLDCAKSYPQEALEVLHSIRRDLKKMAKEKA